MTDMIKTSTEIDLCEVCHTEAFMTRDHVIPKWLIVDVARFGIDWGTIVDKGQLQGKLYKRVCGPCNLAKGGQINYKDPAIQSFMRAFLLEIYEKIGPTPQERGGHRKLKVICGCGRKEPCAVVPGVIAPAAPKSAKFKHDHWKGKCWCGHSVPIISTASPLPVQIAHAA